MYATFSTLVCPVIRQWLQGKLLSGMTDLCFWKKQLEKFFGSCLQLLSLNANPRGFFIMLLSSAHCNADKTLFPHVTTYSQSSGHSGSGWVGRLQVWRVNSSGGVVSKDVSGLPLLQAYQRLCGVLGNEGAGVWQRRTSCGWIKDK